MKKINDFIYKSYRLITGSIAFYPTLIALGFLFFSIVVILIEYDSFMMDLKESISLVLVKSKEDARLVLGTLVGSIISLMVFSFSMVMIVLNRASATLSPRVIPGLITDKSNQIVLGFYMGTIIYCLILIVNIQAEKTNQTPDFGIFMAMLFGINCLAFFMYFIHTISQSIQVDNILKRIQFSTEREMDRLSISGKDEDIELPNTSDWHTLHTPKSGYLKEVKVKELVKFCQKHDLKIKIRERIGFFLVKDYPYLNVSPKPSDELLNEIHSSFIFYPEERLDDHYSFGFKQISEIAVKALSPGINDPGTAIKAINLLSVLYIKKMKMKDKYYVADKENEPRLFFDKLSLHEMLYNNLTSIREYGKSDALVMNTLLKSLKNMLYADQTCEYHEDIVRHIQSIIDSCNAFISNKIDQESLNETLVSINDILSPNYQIQQLKIG